MRSGGVLGCSLITAFSSTPILHLALSPCHVTSGHHRPFRSASYTQADFEIRCAIHLLHGRPCGRWRLTAGSAAGALGCCDDEHSQAHGRVRGYDCLTRQVARWMPPRRVMLDWPPTTTWNVARAQGYGSAAGRPSRVASKPARLRLFAGVSLPRVQAADKRFLSHRQVHELADACGKEYRLLVLFLAYTGLRWVRWQRSACDAWISSAAGCWSPSRSRRSSV